MFIFAVKAVFASYIWLADFAEIVGKTKFKNDYKTNMSPENKLID